MNKALLLVGIAVALLGACSGGQRNETSGAIGAISPWHSLTEAEVQEAAAAVMDSTDDADGTPPLPCLVDPGRRTI